MSAFDLSTRRTCWHVAQAGPVFARGLAVLSDLNRYGSAPALALARETGAPRAGFRNRGSRAWGANEVRLLAVRCQDTPGAGNGDPWHDP